ncbi:hypothetical protein [Streptomyces sp. NPDC006997]|uniref:hypothetical protein n=1 Tax=Streptomyces sp. NPDC006997 TaxID=3155356 RepID=UPI003410B4F9
MSGVRILVDAVVVASALTALAVTGRALARRPAAVGTAGRRVVSPAGWLVLVTALVYVNQVLFTVYVLRVRGGDPAFLARYLPAGWFDLASGQPVVRALAEHWPLPGLLAPSVLRVQAFLELPFVLLAFATVVRWLDADLYRRIARSALLPAASASYTAVFCLVEWDLRNPYTVDDILIRVLSAVLTPLFLAWLAARDTSTSRAPASVPGLLVFIGSLGALGALVLVVYDTALLYSLGRLDDRLPLALVAAVALLGLRTAAPRVSGASSPTLSFVVHALRHWLLLFFVPALAIRYGLLFGTPLLALAVGALTAGVACVRAVRATPDGPRLVVRLGGAVLAGGLAAALAARVTPPSYAEVTLLAAMGAFLVVGVAVCGLLDRASGLRNIRG